MQFQRISSTEFLVFGPMPAVREAAWHALRSTGVLNAVIDADRNIVSGSTGDGFIIAVRIVSATLVETEQGVRVSLAYKAAMGRSVDFGAGRREAGKVGNGLAWALGADLGHLAPPQNAGYPAPIAAPIADPFAAPIAAPAGMTPQPPTPSAYGHVLAPKRGMTLLVYGFLSMIICQILAPFTVGYSLSALKDYRVNGDPGDRGLVVAALVCGVIGCLLFVGAIARLVLFPR